MPIPKKLLQELMTAVPLGRLVKISQNSFLRSQTLSPEACIKKASTPANACMVILQLFRPELLPLAKLLELDPEGLEREALSRKLCYIVKEYDEYQEYKGKDVLSPEFFSERIQKNEEFKKLLIFLSQGVDAGRHPSWPPGMWLAFHCLSTASLMHDPQANVGFAFSHRLPCWPEPLISNLKQVGATKTADLYVDWSKKLLVGDAANLTGDEVGKFAAKFFYQYDDDPKHRKQWRESVKATGEDLEALTRQYLTAHPELFVSN